MVCPIGDLQYTTTDMSEKWDWQKVPLYYLLLLHLASIQLVGHLILKRDLLQ